MSDAAVIAGRRLAVMGAKDLVPAGQIAPRVPAPVGPGPVGSHGARRRRGADGLRAEIRRGDLCRPANFR